MLGIPARHELTAEADGLRRRERIPVFSEQVNGALRMCGDGLPSDAGLMASTPASAAVPPVARRSGDPGSRARRAGALVEHRARILAAIAVLAITLGGLLHLGGDGAVGDAIWRAVVALLAAELACEVSRTVLVDHHMGVDTIALLAMVGSLVLGQELAGVIVGLMFSVSDARGCRLDASAARADGARPARPEVRAAAHRRTVRADTRRARADR